MILAVPKDKKADLYQKLNNARCLSEEEHIFEKCNNNCRFHCENDGELHSEQFSIIFCNIGEKRLTY